MPNALAAKLEKLELAVPRPQPRRHIPLVTTDEQVAAARAAAIAQGIDPDGDEIICIRLCSVEPKWSANP